jgi:hypothetical protein
LFNNDTDDKFLIEQFNAVLFYSDSLLLFELLGTYVIDDISADLIFAQHSLK